MDKLPIDTDVPMSSDAHVKSPEGSDPLSAPGARAQLARRIHEDIDEYCRTTYDGGHRRHLGASQIGHECSRNLWYVFRWVQASQFSGRMQRLFDRGHREEARFIEWLEGIGAHVVEFQPDADGNQNKGEQQYRVKGVLGHFGGSLDGQIKLPERYGVDFGMLSEFKTKSTGASFNKLKEKGVKIVAPQHFDQMCVYGRAYGYKYALYIVINKNDDDLHVEIVELDWNRGEQLERKAADVITSQVPPAKAANSPAHMVCKFCDFKDICHGDKMVEKNCRSCAQASPTQDGEWYCATHQGVIPSDFIPRGCDHYSPIA